MSMPLPVFDTIKVVLGWIEKFRESNNRVEDKHTEALRAIYVAASETESYIAEYNRSFESDRERERALSRLWVEAGVSLRKIDPNLAQRCITKADYWTNPESWSKTDIAKAQINLQTMKDDARALLFK